VTNPTLLSAAVAPFKMRLPRKTTFRWITLHSLPVRLLPVRLPPQPPQVAGPSRSKKPILNPNKPPGAGRVRLRLRLKMRAQATKPLRRVRQAVGPLRLLPRLKIANRKRLPAVRLVQPVPSSLPRPHVLAWRPLPATPKLKARKKPFLKKRLTRHPRLSSSWMRQVKRNLRRNLCVRANWVTLSRAKFAAR